MSYLRPPKEAHECTVPNWRPGPNDERVRQSTDDRVGVVWQCDECGAVWEVRVVVGSWRAYYRLGRRATRRALRRVFPVPQEET